MIKRTVQKFTSIRNLAMTNSVIHSSVEPGRIEKAISEKLQKELKPSYLRLYNDSHKHSHHAPMSDASNTKESHFRIEIISEAFEGKSLTSRHRLIYKLLDDEFKSEGLHALQLKTKTEKESKN